MRRGERGYTILELLLVMGIIGTLFVGVGHTLFETKRTNDLSEAYSADVMGLQRALASLETDLRESTGMEARPFGEVRIETARGPVDYRIQDWALQRVVGGTATVLARGVLDFSVKPEGGLLRATVRLARPHKSGKRKPEMTTLVARRSAEEVR